MGIAWPSFEISQDCRYDASFPAIVPHDFLKAVLVSTSLRLTARLEVGAKVQVFPLSGAGLSKLPPGLPSLRQIQEAATIRLTEISVSPTDTASRHEKKPRDWLCLLLRESLGLFLSCTWKGTSFTSIACWLFLYSRPQIHHMCSDFGSHLRGPKTPLLRRFDLFPATIR